MTHATLLSDEVALTESWLWPQRVALGALTILVGDAGVGKSYLTCDMAARVSRGARWPDEELAPPTREPGGTFLLCAEDDYGDTVRPRLAALGADLSNIFAVRDENGHQAFDLLRYLPKFEREIQAAPNARLWIIDPISSYLGSLRENHDRSVRDLLNPLANLARAQQLAIVLVTHLSKGDGKALHRVLGSRAFAAAARNVWLVQQDTQDKRRRLMLPMKSNRTAMPTGLAFTFESVGSGRGATLRWESEPVPTSADDALDAAAYQPPPRNQLRRSVMTWLEETLADGPLPPDIVRGCAEDRGITYTTLRRAFRELGGRSIWQKQGRTSIRLWQLGPESGEE
jgi:RecA-family ATPase